MTGFLQNSMLDLPPQCLEAEKAILGAALISRTAALTMAEALTPESFYHTAHRKAAQAIIDLARAGEPVDVLSVPEELRRRGQLDACGGLVYLGELADSVPTAAHAKHYAGIVADRATLRWVIDTCEAVKAGCYEGEPAEAVIEGLTLRLLERTRPATGEPVRLSDVLQAEMARIIARKAVPVCYSGITELDQVAGGLGRGEVGIICGRPASGKTALALQQALHAAETWGPGAIVSLEMREDSLARRILAGDTQFTFREIRDAGRWDPMYRLVSPFTPHELDEICAAGERLEAAADRLWIDSQAYELPRIVARLHRLKLQHGIEFAVVDYGQLIKGGLPGRAGKVEEVTHVARALKNEVAVLLDIPVFVLVQANREVEKRQKDGERQARLKLSDLGWSAEWEAVANAVWFLNLERKEGDPVPVALEVAKNRNGEAGREIDLWFHKARFRFLGRDGHHSEADAPPERQAFRD